MNAPLIIDLPTAMMPPDPFTTFRGYAARRADKRPIDPPKFLGPYACGFVHRKSVKKPGTEYRSLNYKCTGTITPGGKLKPAWFSFSEFLVEPLNAKCWAAYQIEAFKKFYLV